MRITSILMLALLMAGCGFPYGGADFGGFSPSQTGDQFEEYPENPFLMVADSPVSTFSVDADGASYTVMKRYVNEKQRLPKEAVRIEEYINYFTFNYPFSSTEHPIEANGEVASCPWKPEHRLIRIGLKGKPFDASVVPPSNIVLLIDVSGSMDSKDKLDLAKDGLALFVGQLRSIDKIAIVTYAGDAGVALSATNGNEKTKILKAIDKLGSGGGTNGEGGIRAAYDIATQNFVPNGNNRIILISDGDFNLGISSQEELIELIEEKRNTGVYLTTIGVGHGNLQDGTMEQLADNGNGNYEYMGDLSDARKIFLYDFNKFYTVAQDVKVQVVFNPKLVESYRLIGYENRVLDQSDFEDDRKDAGEIGAGQTITAIYEIKPAPDAPAARQEETFHIDFRYKRPNEATSTALSFSVRDEQASFESSSENMRFAAAVAGFGMLMRQSQYAGTLSYAKVAQWASAAKSFDPNGLRNSFVELAKKNQ